MQRTRPAQPPDEWEIAYWRIDPYPHWEPIMQCPHSRMVVGMVQRLCEKQPDVHFRLRLASASPPSALALLTRCIAIPGA